MIAVAYARYSTDKQTQNSIAYQLNAINTYCAQNDIKISQIYTDEAESGTSEDSRDGFLDMLFDAKQHKFEAVIIYDISRGARDVADWFNFRKDMSRLGIKVISATQNLGDINNPNDFLVELLSVGIGQHAVLDFRQKSIAGVAEKAKQGKFLGGVAPLGYDIADGEYIINPAEAAIVRQIFAWYADGKSYANIIDALKGTKGKRGRPLGKNSLHSILTNERYIGIYTWNKRKIKIFRKWAGGEANPKCVTIPGVIPPIIDNDTWEAVRKRMQTRPNAINKAKREYLLSGLIECAKCGAIYAGHTSTNKKGVEYRSYICTGKSRTRTCDACNISADELESFVVQNLKMYLLKADFNQVASEIAGRINSAGPDLSAEKKELAAIDAKIQNGIKAILSGIEIPELQAEIERLRIRKNELGDIISVTESGHKKISPEQVEAVFKSSLEHFGESPEMTKRIIRQHVTKIYANTDGSFSVNVGVHMSGCGSQI